jgi:hypothetical protein
LKRSLVLQRFYSSKLLFLTALREEHISKGYVEKACGIGLAYSIQFIIILQSRDLLNYVSQEVLQIISTFSATLAIL